MYFDPKIDKKRFLIAGGSGFLGCNLCKRLKKDGHHITYISRNTHSDDDPDFQYLRQNVIHSAWTINPVDHIFHLASHVSPRDFLKYPDDTLAANAKGTENLLFLAMIKGARFLYASSSRVYRGEDPTEPRAVYEQAKRFGEATVATWARQGKVDARIARIYQTYGPGCRPDDGHVIPTFIRLALKNEPIRVLGGGQWAHFTYVDDTIEGLLRLLYSSETRPVDIGNPKSVKIEVLAQTIVRLCKSKSIIDSQHWEVGDEHPPDMRKMKGLGWEPKVNLDEGLMRTIEYFKGVM